MEVHGGSLYVASFGLGYVLEFNTTTTTKIRSFNITGHNPNGLCLDTSRNLLYVTDAGLNVVTLQPNSNQGMWVINLTNYMVSTIFDNSSTYYPNGCAVKSDGTVYVVQTNVATMGNNKILMVNPSTWAITQASGVLGNWNVTADGIVFDKDGNIYVTSWGSFTVGSGYINVYDGSSWSSAITNLSGPADIGYDGTNNRICIPNYLSSVGMVTDVVTSGGMTFDVYNVFIIVFVAIVSNLF